MKAETIQKGRDRWYPCPLCGDQHVSVTTLLGVIASPALMGWMAKNGTAKLNVLDKAVQDEIDSIKIEENKEMVLEEYALARLAAETRWKLTETTAFWKSGKESGQDAADEGIMADAWLESHFQGVPVDLAALGPKARSMVDNALAWEKKHEVKTLFTQRTFYNCKLNYAGTTDWGGIVDGELTLLDWKRAGAFYFNHIMQIWSYALADESQHGDRLYQKAGIGSLGKVEDPITFFKRNEWAEMARDVLIACGHIFKAQQVWNEKFPWQKKAKPKLTEVKQ